MAYSPPPLRQEDFRDQYLRKRRANLGTVTSIDTPYGENLASRDWKGDPIARGGDGGSDMMSAALAQLSQDNAPPYSSPIPVVTPYGGVGYTRQPFSAGTGRTNFVPGGTVSSVIPQPAAPQTVLNGVPQVEGQGEIGSPIVEPYNPSAPAILTPVQAQQASQARASRAFLASNQNPSANAPTAPVNDPEYQAWVTAENQRRAGNGLGPLDQAFNSFVDDKAQEAGDAQVGQDLYNSLRRQDRLTRESQGYRGRDGRMYADRSSGISPAYAARLQQGARDVARRIRAGESGDAITQAWDSLVQGSSAGAPVPMPHLQTWHQNAQPYLDDP